MLSRRISQVLAGMAASACLSLGAAVSAEPLVNVVALDVDNPSAFATALDLLQESDDVRGTRLGLWVPEFSGNGAVSHIVAVEYDDYADYDKRTRRRLASRDWQTFLGTVRDNSRVVGTSLMIQRMVAGEGWRNHNASAAFTMTVNDPAKYATAFQRLIDAQGHPGSVRLFEVRAGGPGASHVVIITAPGFVALNEYLDKVFASDDFRRFSDDVRSIRTMNAVSQYRRAASWGG